MLLSTVKLAVLGIRVVSQSSLSRFFRQLYFCGERTCAVPGLLWEWCVAALPSRREGYTLDLDSTRLLPEDGSSGGVQVGYTRAGFKRGIPVWLMPKGQLQVNRLSDEPARHSPRLYRHRNHDRLADLSRFLLSAFERLALLERGPREQPFRLSATALTTLQPGETFFAGVAAAVARPALTSTELFATKMNRLVTPPPAPSAAPRFFRVGIPINQR